MISQQNKVNIFLRVALLTFSGCVLMTFASGIRNSYGLLLNPIIEHSGVALASVSLVFAVGQLVYGCVQPLFGILAAKKGGAFTLILGVCVLTVGLVLAPYSQSMVMLMLCFGIILPTGFGILAFSIIVGTLAQKIPRSTLLTVSGFVNACMGLGNIVMSPIINALLRTGGLRFAMHTLTFPALAMIPVSFFLGKKLKAQTIEMQEREFPTAEDNPLEIKPLFLSALKSRTYQFLMIGFFTCGFHMAVITNHLAAQFVAYSFSPDYAAYAFLLYGVTTIVGSLLSASLCNRLKMKNVLGTMYGLRPITIFVFFFLPRTVPVLTAFTALLGFSGASTAPPVTGLINKNFGAKSIAILFGFVLVVHQVGGFFGAWLGGLIFTATGNYYGVWLISLVISAVASVVSFAIRENRS